MKQLHSNRHAISGAFVFLLLGLFAVFALLMTALSAQLYRTTVLSSDQHNERRVLVSYLTNTIHAADQDKSIDVTDIDGIRMLVIRWPLETADMEDPEYDDVDDAGYETRIYSYDGYLRELLMTSDSEFCPEDGAEICRITSFEPQLEEHLLTVRCTDGDGRQATVHVRLWCAPGGEVSQ